MIENMISALGMYWEAFKLGAPAHWAQLQDFDFAYTNSLFWVIVLVLMLLLSVRWGIKKSFSFCIIFAALLLIMTAAEKYLVVWSGATAESKEITIAIVRLVSLGIAAFFSIFYLFMK